MVVIALGAILALTGFSVLGRLDQDDRWRTPTVASGTGVALFAATSDSLGLGTGGGIGWKQVTLAAVGLLRPLGPCPASGDF